MARSGRVPKWTKGTDCKSVIRGFESHLGLYVLFAEARREEGNYVSLSPPGTLLTPFLF
jgi:hypothetical protein